MNTTVRQLTELVGGKCIGDGGMRITGAGTLAEAKAGQISFLEDDRSPGETTGCLADAVLVKSGQGFDGKTLIEVSDPYAAFVTIFKWFNPPLGQPTMGVNPRADVHPTAHIGQDATIHPFACVSEGAVLGNRCTIHPGAVVGRNCRLGDDVIIFPNAVLYDGCILGDRVIVHSNCVLGADGFGYRQENGRHEKSPQLGRVEIADDVEIGAGTTIDRGAFHATRIGEGTKIDNLVQIGHNCQVGKHNLIISQVGIAGSTNTGDYVILAGQAGLADHLEIGDRAIVGAKSGVSKNIPAGQCVLGAPARPVRDFKRIDLNVEKLPDMRRDITKIKKHLGLDGNYEEVQRPRLAS